MLAGYVIVLLAWYAYFGALFQFTLGLFFLIMLPLTLLIGRTTQFVKEITPFLVLLLSYEALQGIEGSLDVIPTIQIGAPHLSASTHNLVGLVQSTFYSPTLTTITSFLYGLHFPLVAVLAVLLWYSDKTLYKRYVFSWWPAPTFPFSFTFYYHPRLPGTLVSPLIFSRTVPTRARLGSMEPS